MSDDDVIWRYMDLAKYVGLLSRGLFFAQPTALGDPWEGSWGGSDVREFRERNQSSAQTVQAAWDAFYVKKRDALARVGVSCWHLSNAESAALWDLYVPQGLGVAVVSTPAKVLASIKDADRPIHTRAVQYRDFADLKLGPDPLTLLSHKRLEYAHECELRFCVEIRGDECEAIQMITDALTRRSARRAPASGFQPLILPGGGFASNDQTVTRRAAPGGIHLVTDAAVLIDRVVLSPQASYPLRRAVLDATAQWGLDRKLVTEPRLDQLPYDRARQSAWTC